MLGGSRRCGSRRLWWMWPWLWLLMVHWDLGLTTAAAACRRMTLPRSARAGAGRCATAARQADSIPPGAAQKNTGFRQLVESRANPRFQGYAFSGAVAELRRTRGVVQKVSSSRGVASCPLRNALAPLSVQLRRVLMSVRHANANRCFSSHGRGARADRHQVIK